MRFGPIEIDHGEGVLEPRVWTLAQAEWAAELPRGPMLELGCGAGQIGLAAAALTGSCIVQVDASEAACRWAGHNAAGAGLAARVEQRCGELGEVLEDEERFAVVIADPPYVASAAVGRYDDPPSAIDGGPDGLEAVREFLRVAAAHLGPGGSIVLQLGEHAQVDAVAAWLDESCTPSLVVVDRRHLGEDRSLALLRRPTDGAPDGARARSDRPARRAAPPLD